MMVRFVVLLVPMHGAMIGIFVFLFGSSSRCPTR